jgi:hypothetical protein
MYLGLVACRLPRLDKVASVDWRAHGGGGLVIADAKSEAS